MKRVLLVIIVAYIYTWVFGVPAAHNTVLREIEKGAKAQFESNEPYQPSFKFGPAFPLLPFTVVSKHSYVVGNVWAGDGWWIFFGLFNKYKCGAIYAKIS